VKLQWKPDFGMRWAALGVDFEMFGKDHQTNAPIYDRICEILGGVKPPEHYVYELFLDENGQKISKSKGNGLTIDEWLTYARPRASRSTCSRSRAWPSGSISTSSRARWMITRGDPAEGL
jgi:lysyl-tRNA synthetase, class I